MTTVFLFYIKKKYRFWAFSRMALWPGKFAAVEGVSFSKLMGSGADEGFGFLPNFNIYALLLQWDNDADQAQFLKTNALLQAYRDRSDHVLQLTAQSFKAHGSWGGQSPFQQGDRMPNAPIMVLTRASITWSKALKFWKHVPLTAKAIQGAGEKILSIGVGELPWVEQATISIWPSEDAVKRFAYGQKDHLEAIRMTKELGWYKEELFARFSVIGMEGSWPGLEVASY